MIGSILVHMTVNVINDYHDYVDGIDLNTQRTPFSGGSGVLPSNLLKPKQAFWFATVCLLMAMVIGIYFVMVKGWLLFPLLLVAGFSAYFYNVYLSKWLMGEIFAGLNFGPLLVLGSYYVQTGRYSWETLFASFAPGILTSNLLFLNEFPDWEADQKRREKTPCHLPWEEGCELSLRGFAHCLLSLHYYWGRYQDDACGDTHWIWGRSVWMEGGKGALKYYNDTEKLVPVLGANVITILGNAGPLGCWICDRAWSSYRRERLLHFKTE